MIGDNAQAILAKRNAHAEARRAAMPETTRRLAEVKAMGFPDARVTYAVEGGHTFGRPITGREVRADQIAFGLCKSPDAEHAPISTAVKYKSMEKAQEHLFA